MGGLFKACAGRRCHPCRATTRERGLTATAAPPGAAFSAKRRRQTVGACHIPSRPLANREVVPEEHQQVAAKHLILVRKIEPHQWWPQEWPPIGKLVNDLSALRSPIAPRFFERGCLNTNFLLAVVCVSPPFIRSGSCRLIIFNPLLRPGSSAPSASIPRLKLPAAKLAS